jgi:universal stress protein E
MYGVQKLLVGVDLICADPSAPAYELPPPTMEAIELGLQIGARSKAQVLFLTVMPPDDSVPDNPVATGILNDLLAEAQERGVQATSKIVVGRAWMEIIRQVQDGGHDMVLVGSRNHRARERLMGTTGTKLLRKCPCPVWVARPDTSNDVPLVMVADDLTPVGAHSVQLGVSAAQILEARLLIVNAVQYPLEAGLRRTGCPPEEIDEHRDAQIADAKRIINEHLAQTDYRTLSQGTNVEITHGPPDVVIFNAMEEHPTDLLVMGTIARSGIPGLLVGNTAERLLPQVECSVLAVKPEGFESPVRFD